MPGTPVPRSPWTIHSPATHSHNQSYTEQGWMGLALALSQAQALIHRQVLLKPHHISWFILWTNTSKKQHSLVCSKRCFRCQHSDPRASGHLQIRSHIHKQPLGYHQLCKTGVKWRLSPIILLVPSQQQNRNALLIIPTFICVLTPMRCVSLSLQEFSLTSSALLIFFLSPLKKHAAKRP